MDLCREGASDIVNGSIMQSFSPLMGDSTQSQSLPLAVIVHA